MKKPISQMEPWIGKEEEKALVNYLRSGGWLTEYKKTQEFEKEIADYVGSKHASVVSNGTVSLFISLMALGVGKGDEVLVPDFTMIASANAVILAGAKPVLVDINPNNLCLDLEKAEKSLTRKTKAMMFVNINGRSPNMKNIVSFCKKRKIYLVEDAAQALGSRWHGKHLGTFGIIGSFSFSVPKIITTGQGGALVTDDDKLIEKIRKIKDFGRKKSGVDEHVDLGYNFKFTDLQAVIGIEQMKKLPIRVKRKKEIFALYQKELSGVGEVKFIDTNLIDTSPWFIDVLVENRKLLISYLVQKGIGCRPFYPPIHTQVPYSGWMEYQDSKFSVSEEISRRGLWLPSSSFLSNSDIKETCRQIKSFYEKN
jgi:perosamine synthetase